MTSADLLRFRLHNQHLTGPRLKKPEDVVTRLGAVQAQEYGSAKWAIAERTGAVDEAALDRLFDAGRILRTHVMRPTWHFVRPEDIRWMLELTAPRVNAVCRSYYAKLKLDDRFFARSHAVIARALRGGRHLTRTELASRLRDAGVTPARNDSIRLGFIMMRAELDAVICSGPRAGKQHTYALVDERVPRAKRRARDAARSELARRYFESHGPATVRDFAWWSGMTAADARAGVESLRPALVSNAIDGKTYWRFDGEPPARAARTAHLLTTYDECFVAYRDRVPLDPQLARQIARGGGQTVVVGGRVAGTWTRTVARDRVALHVRTCAPLRPQERDAVAAAAERYARFLGLPVSVWFDR